MSAMVFERTPIVRWAALDRRPRYHAARGHAARTESKASTATREQETMSHRSIFIAYLLTSILSACASGDEGGEPSLPSTRLDAQTAADAILGRALTLNSEVHSAFDRAEADLEADEFLLYDEIRRSLQEIGISNFHLFESAAEEILEQMQMAEEEPLATRIYAIVLRFAELSSLPRESIPEPRLANYLDDAQQLHSEVWAIVTDDSGDRTKAAYYFAPAYNVVASTYIFGLATAGYSRGAIEITYRSAIEANQHLVGTGEADDLGYLSDWVASQTPGGASARVKIDKDPILYSIRRSLEEQQRALE